MKAPKRILHVFGAMNRGGAETLVMNVYRQIDRSEIQFDFAVQTEQPGDYDEEILALGGRILRHPVPAEVGLRRYGRAFARTLGRCGPFAGVHSHVQLFSGLLLRLSAQQRVPVRVSHSHTTRDDEGGSLKRLVYRRCMRSLIRRHASHLLGCSRAACESLFGPRCWADRRVQSLPNAICLEEFAGLDESGRSLRKELLLPHDTPLVGHVGSFSPPKNHPFLIEVFEALLRRLPAAHLVLAGDGAQRPQVEESVRTAGITDRVHLLGVRPDIPRIMAGLDLLLLPSLWEGLPVVLVEAQAAGVPCLVSDTVTTEADLGLGLLRFASLREGSQLWAERGLAQVHAARPSWNERERALRQAGYDVRSVARRLVDVYSN